MRKLSTTVVIAAFLVACGQGEAPSTDADSTGSDAAGSDTPGAGAGAAGSIEFTTDDERTLYALGLVLGQNIGDFSLTEQELAFVTAGMRDVVTDTPHQLDLNIYGPMIQGLVERRLMVLVDEEKAASAAYGEEIAAEPGAERTASGLIFVPMTAGDGASPSAADLVSVHYHGTLRDGTVFDSSRERGTPYQTTLNQVIPCWTEGVQMMQVGGTAKLFCPSDIAYGDTGSPPVIAGGAALIFEVELLEILE